MILSSFFVSLMVLRAFGEDYTPGSDDYFWKFLIPMLSPVNPFDGLSSITNVKTRPSLNKLPTVKQMMYYNYYAATAYYIYDLDDLSCEWCLKIKPDISDYKVLNNETHLTLAIVALSHARKEIVVSFRGAINIWNFVLDGIFNNDNVPGRPKSDKIKMHTGFYIATMSLYENVVQNISSYRNKNRNYKIVLTGHSLGAALARITYFFLKDLNQFPGANYEIYTYGEPRVGNIPFAEFMNSQTITSARVVARADFVPHIPPTSIMGTDLFIGNYYVHSQPEFWIDGADKQRFCNLSVYEDPKCSMSMGPLYTVIDHFTYFDVNLASVATQPFQFLALPFDILNPVRDIPPLPKKVEKQIGDTLSSFVTFVWLIKNTKQNKVLCFSFHLLQ